jgi:hypothetical protein
MAEIRTSPAARATDLLRSDHVRIREFLTRAEQRDDASALEDAVRELAAHAKLESELFYPAVRRAEGSVELLEEAAERLHVIELVARELEGMSPQAPRFWAKASILAELARSHVEQEEAEILPKAEKGGIDLEQLGRELVRRRAELTEPAPAPSARRGTAPRRRGVKKGLHRRYRVGRGRRVMMSP